LTYHNDALRTALNPAEIALTPANVNASNFGKLGEVPVDGMIDAQPLYVAQLAVGAARHNVLYVATQNDTVYAFDADSFNGNAATVLWQASLLSASETAVPPGDLVVCPGNNVLNGIMATPVIDRARNAIYVVAFSENSARQFSYRLHALDLTSGKELFGGPVAIQAQYPGSGGNSSGGVVTFDPAVHQARAALLADSGHITIAWGARSGDCGNYSSWVMRYDATTLAQTSVINLVPNDRGAGIWMSGAGPAMDASGDIYLATGNAYPVSGDATPATGSYANAVVRLSGGGALQLVDYFAPANEGLLNANDLDLGGGGVLLLPDQADATGALRHLAVLAGKDGNIYLVDRDNLGHFNTSSNAVVQKVDGQLGGQEFRSAPAWFNGRVYFAAAADPLKAFKLNSAQLSAAPVSQSAHAFANGVPVISANGSRDGVIWVDEGGPGVLYAYDAADLGHLLYSSDQAPANRDQFGRSDRPKTPLVVNGRVYLGTSYSIAAFGLLH
jgi:hypothetical protein